MITENDIKSAAEILLQSGAVFDEERTAFIQNLQTRDLCAVPGSGKTTALQAKLLCLAHHQGKDFNEGILALSYTNSAVSSIKTRLSAHVPNIVKYPNYIGTVHSFLNRFVANIASHVLYRTRIHICDTNKYEKELINQIKELNSRDYYAFRNFLERKNAKLSTLYIDYKSKNICLPNGKILLKAEAASTSYNIFLQAKNNLNKKGVFSYDDSIRLSSWGIESISLISVLLRKRFKYVFIDEAQDLSVDLIQLLKTIFSESEDSIIQFIGDPNQSIYSSSGDTWKPYNPLSISISHRVSKNIANTINLLVTERKDLICQSCIDNGIPPHLILFDSSTIAYLEKTFAELIIKYKIQLKQHAKNGFYIIGWNVKVLPNEDKKDELLRMGTLFPDKVISEKNDTSLNWQNPRTIVRWLTELLYSYSSSHYRQENHIENYNDFVQVIHRQLAEKWNLALFHICSVISIGDVEKFRSYIIRLLEILSSVGMFDSLEIASKIKTEIFSIKTFSSVSYSSYGIPLQFASVHASKGRTYAAVMYVETAYLKHNDSYYLFPSLFSQNNKHNTNKTILSAKKVAYVGFSRPVDLLCYAVKKSAVDESNMEQICSLGWKVIDITAANN